MSTPRFAAVRNGQVIATRSTNRNYTHAVAVVEINPAVVREQRDNAIETRKLDAAARAEYDMQTEKRIAAFSPFVLNWCGNLALAQKARNAAMKTHRAFNLEIVTVEPMKSEKPAKAAAAPEAATPAAAPAAPVQAPKKARQPAAQAAAKKAAPKAAAPAVKAPATAWGSTFRAVSTGHALDVGGDIAKAADWIESQGAGQLIERLNETAVLAWELKAGQWWLVNSAGNPIHQQRPC